MSPSGLRPALLAEPVRFTYVDLLRGLSAIAVLFFHYRMFYPDGNVVGAQSFDGRHMPYFEFLWPLYLHGNLAVQFFWLLSGFVFMATYGRQQGTIDPSRFFVWRFSRLYPLHFVTLIYLAVVQWLSLRTTGSFSVVPINDAYHFVLQLFLASNWGLQRGDSFNTPIWSVSVEIVIYLAFFLFMRFGRTGPVALGTMVGAFATLSLLIDNPIATCGFLFFLGMALFRICRWIAGFGGVIALSLALTALGASVLLATIAGDRAVMIVMFLCLPAALNLVATIDRFAPPVSPNLYWVGDITYAIYLIHIPMIVTITLWSRYAGLPNDLPDRSWFLPTYLIGVVAAGVIVHRRFELPAQKWLRSYWKLRSAAMAQTGANEPVASLSK